MPELPEVESARCLVERNCIGKQITQIVAVDDDKIFQGFKAADLKKALENRVIKAARRKGKYLWFELDDDAITPVWHFGMTGSFVVENVQATKYVRLKAEEGGEWPPRFTKVELLFDNGTKLALTDPRRFAKVFLVQDPLNSAPLNKLGFDSYLELPPKDKFAEALAPYQRGNLKVKALLLDQSFSAGVGNWVADEVLYQARIHPEHPVAHLEPEHITALWESLEMVIHTAVKVDADAARFPASWLFHYRWTGKKTSSIEGHAIQFITVGSRTSAFVPHLQKLPHGMRLEQMAKRKKKGAAGRDEAAGESMDVSSGRRQGRKRKATQKEEVRSPEDRDLGDGEPHENQVADKISNRKTKPARQANTNQAKPAAKKPSRSNSKPAASRQSKSTNKPSSKPRSQSNAPVHAKLESQACEGAAEQEPRPKQPPRGKVLKRQPTKHVKDAEEEEVAFLSAPALKAQGLQKDAGMVAKQRIVAAASRKRGRTLAQKEGGGNLEVITKSKRGRK